MTLMLSNANSLNMSLMQRKYGFFVEVNIAPCELQLYRI